MSQDRTAVTKTSRWDLVIPHDKPKPYRKAVQCDCSTVYRQVCDACAGTPPLPILRLDPPWCSPTEISPRETFSNQAECGHVPGCVRVAGHPSFHTTSEAIAKKEDAK